MAKAYLLSDVNNRVSSVVAVYNNAERAYNDAFAMLADERTGGAATLSAPSETGMLRVEGELEPVGAAELKAMLRDAPSGTYVDLRDEYHGDRVRVTYMEVR